jgi:hypothetical protein
MTNVIDFATGKPRTVQFATGYWITDFHARRHPDDCVDFHAVLDGTAGLELGRIAGALALQSVATLNGVVVPFRRAQPLPETQGAAARVWLEAEPETGEGAHYLEVRLTRRHAEALMLAAMSLGLGEFDWGEEAAA